MFSKPVITFCLLSFAISWGVVLGLYPFGFFEGGAKATIAAMLFMCGPAFAALICARIFDKGEMIATLGLKFVWNRWMVIAWAAAALLCLASVGVSLLVPNISHISIREGLLASGALPETANLPSFIGIIVVIQALTLGAAINGVLLISEELGWRGFLWNKLIKYGFWRTCLFTGIVWGVWHAPLIYLGHNYPEYPIAGIFFMVIFTLGLTPIISYIRLKNGSVWAASLFHGTINALAGLTVLCLSSSQGELPPLWRGMIGLGGTLVLLIGCIWVCFSVRSHLITIKRQNHSYLLQ